MSQTFEVNIRDDRSAWTPRPTLGSADYASEEVYRQEQERIWWGDWVCVGRTEEISDPGDYVVRDVAGESIFIVRNDAGELRAFYNVCSHRGTKFVDDVEGTGSVRKAFKCPYHAWTFDLNGRLIGTPNVREDEHFDRSKYPLYDIAVDDYAGFLFVNMSGQPRPLMEALTDGAETITVFERFKMQELRVGVRIVYEVAANWKIVVENYHECLHCPTVHPELVKIMPLYRTGEVEEEGQTLGNSMGELTSFTESGYSALPTLPGLDDVDVHTFYGAYVFPNLILNYHSETVNSVTIHPLGPDRSLVVSEFLFAPETVADHGFDPSEVVDFRDLVARQDWEVCERAHTGVRSRFYANGWYPRQEKWIRSFNERYLVARDG